MLNRYLIDEYAHDLLKNGPVESQSRLAFYAYKARKRATDAIGRWLDLGVGVELGAFLWVLVALLAGVSWWLWLVNGGGK